MDLFEKVSTGLYDIILRGLKMGIFEFQLRRFMSQTELGPTKRRFEEAEEVLEGNIRWKEKNIKTVISWLKNFMTNG